MLQDCVMFCLESKHFRFRVWLCRCVTYFCDGCLAELQKSPVTVLMSFLLESFSKHVLFLGRTSNHGSQCICEVPSSPMICMSLGTFFRNEITSCICDNQAVLHPLKHYQSVLFFSVLQRVHWHITQFSLCCQKIRTFLHHPVFSRTIYTFKRGRSMVSNINPVRVRCVHHNNIK